MHRNFPFTKLWSFTKFDALFLISLTKSDIAITGLVRDIKNNASNFVNDHNFVKGKFAWQESFGVFSYSHSHIGKVYDYILNPHCS